MKNEGIQIRISDLLYAFFKHRFLIVALTSAGLLIGIVLSCVSYLRGDISREYRVASSFAINTRVSDGRYSSGSAFPMSSDVQLAEDMASAVMYVINSSKTLDTAISSLRLADVTVGDVRSNLSLSQYENTHIVVMTLYWRDADEGVAILNAINSVSNNVLRETLNVGGITVIEPPAAQYLVGGSLNAALCGALAVLGLVAGLGIAVMDLIIRPTLLNPRDLETSFNLEILAEVPTDDAYFRQKGSVLMRSNAYPMIADSYASMAHIVHNRIGGKGKHHIVYVSSPTRGEGRTTAVANLAIQLADTEKKVLMIDFDLRNPQLGSMFLENVEYDHSLNALYRGDINVGEAITSLTGNLDILPAVLERNSIPLDSNIFALVKKLSEHYDYVLMDTAPVGLSASALNLNEVATAAVLVVRFDTATVQEIRDTLDRMDKSGVRMMGCVVNDVRVSDAAAKRAKPARERRSHKSGTENFMDSADSAARAPGRILFEEEEGELESPNKLAPDATADDFANMLFRMYGGKDEEKAEPVNQVQPAAQTAAEPEASAEPAREIVVPGRIEESGAAENVAPMPAAAKKKGTLFGKGGKH